MMREYNQKANFGPMFTAVTAMVSPIHQALTQQPLYEQVEPLRLHHGLTMISYKIVDRIERWHRRYSGRRSLVTLDDRLLRDIGVERSQALEEGDKPFWRK